MMEANAAHGDAEYKNERQQKGVEAARRGDIRPVHVNVVQNDGAVQGVNVTIRNGDPAEGDTSEYAVFVGPHGVATGCGCPDAAYNLPDSDATRCKHQHAVNKLLSEVRMYVEDDLMNVEDAIARVPGEDAVIRVLYNYLENEA